MQMASTHACVSVCSMSELPSSQFWSPSSCLSSVRHVRFLTCVPLSHVTEHADHGSHDPQGASTARSRVLKVKASEFMVRIKKYGGRLKAHTHMPILEGLADYSSESLILTPTQL